MQILNMVKALQLQKKNALYNDLMTTWGEKTAEEYLCMQNGKVTGVKPEQDGKQPVLSEYPRPQMVRDNYTILNGVWKYAFNHTLSIPHADAWQGDILVPFSPEALLSGVGRQLQPNEYLWYERSIYLDKIPEKKRLLLHFGAVDERCRVFVNGSKVGDHAGGYQSFTMDITRAIHEGENFLNVWVKDVSDTSFHGRGKQMLKRGGMFYTAQSGIWQTVWMEWVPEYYISSIKITPLYDEDSVKIEIIEAGGSLLDKMNVYNETLKVQETNDDFIKQNDFEELASGENHEMTDDSCDVTVYDSGERVAHMHLEHSITKTKENGLKTITTVLMIPNKKSWSPISPFLYDLEVRVGEDIVTSYFGMRIFSIEKNYEGVNRICLNHMPYFQNGVLDQGYWPESLLTPVSEEAMLYDIQLAKKMGFNMIRKHCKVEPMRWYYLCDKEGMIVWQDMINGGTTYNLVLSCYLPTFLPQLRKSKDNFYRHAFTSRSDEKSRVEWKRDCRNTISQLYNVPSICTWVLFNEGWGQFDAADNTDFAKQIDSTRLIDSASGWFDQCCGDIKSIHVYFFDIKMENHKRAFALSEYGGYGFAVPDHYYSDNLFGYQHYENVDEFRKDYKALQKKINEMKKSGMSASVYTQLSDVEEEINGLVTYDRKVCKLY